MINIFNNARIKLTAFYLLIITIILLFFSSIIYKGATFELDRIENMQRQRRPNPAFVLDPEIVRETKSRILFSILTLNGAILIITGVSGYFLAGKTLKPISDMLSEQKEFISNASHELRTPLASIKSQIEVGLRDKKMNLKTAKDLLESSLEDVNNMTKLSNYLLRLNKIQDVNSSLQLSKVDLAEIVKKGLVKKKVDLNLEKTIVYGNAEALSELVSILVDNAIKYGDSKSIRVTTKNKTLIVSDHGVGISKEDLPHIFDRFFRSDKARSKDGYGLGLSIAKQIVERHNAKIQVTSKLGVGSTFKVIFS